MGVSLAAAHVCVGVRVGVAVAHVLRHHGHPVREAGGGVPVVSAVVARVFRRAATTSSAPVFSAAGDG